MELTLAQLIRLYTVLCLANNKWPNDPANLELIDKVNDAINEKLG